MMNRRFRQSDHQLPELNMASLPDLIFTVLFFFMIVTHMRDVEKRVDYALPAGTNIEAEQHKSAVVHLYIGHLRDGSTDDYQIQLNNRLTTIDELPRLINAERSAMSAEDQERLTVSLEADRDVPLAVIDGVKQALRRSYALSVSYVATPRH